MGLTRKSVGLSTIHEIPDIIKDKGNKKIIALAGNPNVGKSSLFNTITGMHQHTGNWPGKTVRSAIGSCIYNDTEYIFADLPGCYSLKTHSPEEEVARNFIMSGNADATVVVCDATSLERNLFLALQIKEITNNVIICVNLMDEASKKHIDIDLQKLSELIHCPVIGTVAHKKRYAKKLISIIDSSIQKNKLNDIPPPFSYPLYIEQILSDLSQQFDSSPQKNRIHALEILENNTLSLHGKSPQEINDDIVSTISNKASMIAKSTVSSTDNKADYADLKIDKFLTGKLFGFFSMFMLLLIIFWITITGANYPSRLLSNMFTSLEKPIYDFLLFIHIPKIICEMTVYGIYHILTWIISVMLPPMAIFFPFFTLLEDIGYLPRIAFNLDKCFKKCNACGKQALTMCMGFGCNAAGVVGCRIIDSPRERLIATITNSFIPCNGRFPAIIAVITMFFIAETSDLLNSFLSALYLAVIIIFGILMSMLISKLLSHTLLKGVPSSFTLELPPYRKPQFAKIIIRSVFDRTLFVLGRAITVAAPAGLIIWIFANINLGGVSILTHISTFLDPLGRLMGLDGIILTAFVFGFPANEIVLPLIIMMYMSNGILTETGDLSFVKELLTANGWTHITAINTIIFMLMHWPCSTTCLTIKAETKSWKWTFCSIAIPTVCGIITCILINILL